MRCIIISEHYADKRPLLLGVCLADTEEGVCTQYVGLRHCDLGLCMVQALNGAFIFMAGLSVQESLCYHPGTSSDSLIFNSCCEVQTWPEASSLFRMAWTSTLFEHPPTLAHPQLPQGRSALHRCGK